MNARGLGDRLKRTQVFSWLRSNKACIFFLQETHSTLESEKLWKDDWGLGSIFFSHGTSNSRGVCILLKDIPDFIVEKEYHDDEGRFI